MTKSRRVFLSVGVLLLWSAVLVLSLYTVALAAQKGGDRQGLLTKYNLISAKLENNQFGAPIYLESVKSGDSLRVDTYGTFNYPFDAVRDALRAPANWCDITSLHINIKACSWRKNGGQSQLTLYSGRKYYQDPSDAYPLEMDFRVLSDQPQYLDVSLAADEGPLGTEDHRIRLEATPLDKDKTFLHFSYSYKEGAVARMAVRGYLSTIGRDKVGFTVVSRKKGKPVYVEGVRGALERNTVRYYLALQSYMDTLKYPEPQRFEQRINRWYDLTARYPRQLKENEKGEYLADKRREHKNQLKLQKNAVK